MRAINALMSGLIDYAGMFPPAGVPSPQALAAYTSYRQGPHGWMLGALVMSSAVLAQLDAVAEDLARVPHLSIVIAGDPEMQLDAALTHADAGRRYGRRTSIEFPTLAPDLIVAMAGKLPEDVDGFFDTPSDEHLEARLDAVRAAGAVARLRTGGVSASAFPRSHDVYRFLQGCVDRRLRCKATAGLHHAISGRYALTNEPGSAEAPMFGFLNVAAAAALTWTGAGEAEVTAALCDSSAAAFRFDDDGWGWGRHRWSVQETLALRQELLCSFGSSSFEEPVDELTRLGVL